MRGRKILVVILVSAMVGNSSTVAQAWWGNLLYPGAMVFDVTRFSDSVRETEQIIMAVQNTLENLNNRVQRLTLVSSPLGQAILGSGSMPAGKNARELRTIQQQAKVKADHNEVYQEVLWRSVENANEDFGFTAQKTFQNQQQRDRVQQEVLETTTVGVLGEMQKKNATAVLVAIENIDQAHVQGAQFMQQVILQEAQYTTNRIEREKAQVGEFYGYDPYHPNAYDLEKRVVLTRGLGFMQYGE